MYDAWSGLFTLAGAGALSYLAANPDVAKKKNGFQLRLSLDENQSLLGDVRLLGGTATALASYWAKGEGTRKTLGIVTLASFASLVCTEVVRMRLKSSKIVAIADAPLLPFGQTSFGAMPQNQRQGAWAAR